MPAYGYARVSTEGQTLSAQESALHEAGQLDEPVGVVELGLLGGRRLSARQASLGSDQGRRRRALHAPVHGPTVPHSYSL